MTYMDQSIEVLAAAQEGEAPSSYGTREPIVLVVEDDEEFSSALRAVCDCLDVVVERMPSHSDLGSLLTERRPMAVVAAMDGAGQDGCHVLMAVAAYDPALPVLLITNDDPAFLGAIEAVEEIWQLRSVVKWPRLLGVGALIDFLFRAGRNGRCMRLMPL